ncbi:XdhC family protein [Terracidiphilus gabretensis]|uniref:XdhC family protein n=1 Tax=Terracidiphilus gabretensis TaxID=1577687 RepID=UPI00071BD2BC|nr:XdhC/CoxI family protein [Terracidiphilus gabretensis]
MTDLEQILPLWRELEASGAEYVLATVVKVEGSSYRKPGARMLLAADGRRAGTVSGGCLEAAVAKKAWWLTESGPVVKDYSTLEDDGEFPYGSGCGGVVWILLERRGSADEVLKALEQAWNARVPLAIATVLEGERIGQRAFARAAGDLELTTLEKFHADLPVWIEEHAARLGLWVFGAGDDAKPLVKMARMLGWYVAIADGRSHLATAGRFVEADAVSVLTADELPPFDVRTGDAAVVMTHSFEQDVLILAGLMSRAAWPAYIGVLGPQRRTQELLGNVARKLDLAPSEKLFRGWLADLHAPTGLDLGAETPAAIALSIMAEIQKTLMGGTALPLRQVRGMRAAVRG